MVGVLFSLPVHERPDIVRDQLENIQHFCPGAKVCIHVSGLVAHERHLFESACDLPDVFVNPNSRETGHSTGLLHAHISSFEHALSLGVEFDKVVLISSNEMFVRRGAMEVIANFEIGAQTEIFDAAGGWHLFRQDIAEDERMRGFLKRLGLPVYFGGQAEGQFFSKEIFQLIADLYTQFFGIEPCGFESEEVIPATVAARFCMVGRAATLPLTLCDYCTITTMSEDLVEAVIRGEGSLFAMRYPRNLRSPHFGSSVLGSVFSVKRVPRTECDLRTFIRGLKNAER